VFWRFIFYIQDTNNNEQQQYQQEIKQHKHRQNEGIQLDQVLKNV